MLPYPETEPGLRLGRLRSRMEEAGLNALLVYSKQWKAEVIHYVSNYRMLGPYSWCLVPLEGEPVLYLSEPLDERRAKAESWISNVRVIEEGNAFAPVQDCGLISGSIGVVGLEIMGAPVYRAVSEGLGDRLVNAFPLLDQAAKIKSEWELEHIIIGGKLGDMGFLAELAAAKPGIKEYELAAELNYEMIRNGADDNFQMFSFGRKLDCMHVPRENALQEGDLILAEITPYIGSMNYATQLCRTAKSGEVVKIEKEKYGLLAEALEEALAVMRPGVPMREVAAVMNRIIGGAGYEKYCHPPFMRSRGHSFGLGQIDLTEDNEELLAPGMAMVVHPNQMIPEVGYLACGETVYVTETGIVRVSGLPPKLYETGGVS